MTNPPLDVAASLENLATLEAASPGPQRIENFTARRGELARAALAALADHGFAQTSLREIARKTDFSHGVLHYYFTDKVDLITCAVRDYKAICVTRYDHLLVDAITEEEFVQGFIDVALDSLVKEAPLHRLWYDLRVQAMFLDAYREEILKIDARLEDMVWAVFQRYCEIKGTQPKIAKSTLYGLFDGIFQVSLLKLVAGTPEHELLLGEEIRLLLKTCANDMQPAG